jgi:nitrous oxide reductase
MDDGTRLQLEKLIKEYDTEETTDKIRGLKHSKKIRDDINVMERLKQTHSRMREKTPDTFKQMCVTQCSFLFTNYTNIFNKLFKDEIDLNIMKDFLEILYNIEQGKLDQHEGSYKVGMILKELYIDSALRNEKRTDGINRKRAKSGKSVKHSSKPINWKEYKILHTMY